MLGVIVSSIFLPKIFLPVSSLHSVLRCAAPPVLVGLEVRVEVGRVAVFEVRLAAGLERLPACGPLGRIELRVLRGKSGTGGLEPGVELGTQGLDAVRFGARNILLLARIGGQVVQFVAAVLVVVDQLPVVLGDDRGRLAALVAVVRVVPEQRAVGDRTALRAGARGSRRRRPARPARARPRVRAAWDTSRCR